MTIRGRVVLACIVLTAACIGMAYIAKQHPENPDPNIVWLYFAFWPGAVGFLTAFGSWIATGRPW